MLQRSLSWRGLVLLTTIGMLVGMLAPAAFASHGSSTPPEQEWRATEDVGTTLAEVSRALGISSKRGDQIITATGEGVQIALIDTGVVDVEGLRHSNVVIGPDFSFEDAAENLRGRDTNGHGTHMAGIMVASDAGWNDGHRRRSDDRTIGIAPGAELVSMKVAGANGAVDVTQVIAAINWVIEHKDDPGMNIRVLALAYGTDTMQPYEIDPLAYAVERAWNAGIVVVVAAGNDGNDATSLRMPAADPFVIAVGSVDIGDGTRRHWDTSDFSNGAEDRHVDLVAPGRSIVSLRVPGSSSDEVNEAGRVGDHLVRGSGTSQAAAVAAGAAALLLEERPDLTPDQVKEVLVDAALPLAGIPVEVQGAGLLSLRGAMHRAANDEAQDFTPSDGSGSIQATRGSSVLELDGVPLTGEIDIFGNSWSGNSWSVDSWSGNSWSGNSWSGNSWSSFSWSGLSWTGNSWSGNSWSGNSWSGLSWTGNSWSGNSWSGNSWSGLSWAGNSWSGNSWSGNSWSDHTWE